MEKVSLMKWKYQDTVLSGYSENNQKINLKKVIGLDMDGTLIQVKSGAKFPKDGDDWIFFHP